MKGFATALARWLCVLALLAFRLPAFAEEASSACPPMATAPSLAQWQAGTSAGVDRGFLWRIRKAGRSSYLYGTVHVAEASWTLPGPALLQALRSSDTVALELDLLDPDVVARLHEGMAWRADRAVSAALNARLKTELKAACLPTQLLASMAPEMLANTLTVLAARRQGLDPAYAIDLVLDGAARGMGKPVVSLETPELQLHALLGRTPEETQALVQEALDELDSGQAADMLVRVARVWADGRLDELEHYGQWCDCLRTERDRALYKRLLDERNPGLAERIDALHMSGKQVLAAVGSLHMVGSSGLPALLARMGYTVERVSFGADAQIGKKTPPGGAFDAKGDESVKAAN